VYFNNEGISMVKNKELKAMGVPLKNAALNGMGRALFKSGNYTGAIKYLDKALAIDPNYKLALNNKAWALKQLIPQAATNRNPKCVK
jgi:tetratricopeptide (TPR) repeat protein